MKIADFILGTCEYCGETVFTIEDRYRSEDGKIIHARCGQPAQIQDALSKLEDIEK